MSWRSLLSLKTSWMNYFKISVFCIFFIARIQGQKITKEFISPVDHQIVLAGSFGEVRSTHFHSGLDIKPYSNSSVDSIRSIGLAYVSRLKISRTSYGKALYLDHPNGYTSVYAHLSEFSPRLTEFVLSKQRNAQAYEIEIFPAPGELIFEKGEVIGIMGNTGRSYGKHLHFEIRDTYSEEPINPILFGIGPNDSVPPTIDRVGIYGLGSQYEVLDRKSFIPQKKLYQKLIHSTKAGIGIVGFDQMDEATNKNGIYEYKVFVDDTLYYHQVMDRVNFEEMNQIKAHIDYPTKTKSKITYALAYQLPGNDLMVIDSCRNRGVFSVFPDKSRHVKIEVNDFAGNIKKVEFQLLGSMLKKRKPINGQNKLYTLKFDQKHTIQSDEITLNIPYQALRKTEQIEVKWDSLSKQYTIGSKDVALLKKAKLSIKTNTQKDENVILVQLDNGKMVHYGTECKGGYCTSMIGSLGEYRIYKDSIKPEIIPEHYPQKNNGRYSFILKDNVVTKGNAKPLEYHVFINNLWIPCEYKSLEKRLFINSSWVKENDQIRIVAKDGSNNESTWINY